MHLLHNHTAYLIPINNIYNIYSAQADSSDYAASKAQGGETMKGSSTRGQPHMDLRLLKSMYHPGAENTQTNGT